MILYDPGDSLRIVFKYVGTIWPDVFKPFLVWSALALGYYIFVEETHPPKNQDTASLLASAMTFLLVFRLQQAYSRYWQGRTCVSEFFVLMRNLMMMTCLLTRGGASTMAWQSGQPNMTGTLPDDESDERARVFRCNMGRYILAYAVVLKLHTRIASAYCEDFGEIDKEGKWMVDWDRLRLRQLLNQKEFELVDRTFRICDEGYRKTKLEDLANLFRQRGEQGPPASWPNSFEVHTKRRARAHFVLIFYLRQEIVRSIQDAANAQQMWGVKERYCTKMTDLLNQAQKNFDMINQIIMTPIALPYAALCKTLCLIWMVSNPVTLDHSLGFIGSYVISAIVVVALLGIDSISAELENPFGDDANDLDILEHIHLLETEVLEFLDRCGDNKARQKFAWRRMPGFIAEGSVKPLTRHLTFSEHAAEEVVASQNCTPASSHRSTDRLLSESSSQSGSRSSR